MSVRTPGSPIGDVVRVPPVRTAAPERLAKPAVAASRSRRRSCIEDDALIAVDKPAGLAVHGGSGIALGMIEQLRAARPDARFLELVHRLDRDTSGVLLVAKKRSALTALHAQLRDGDVDKRYVALVRGPWRDAKRTVDVPLHKYSTRDGERRVRVEETGRESATIFRRETTWPDHDPPLALLEAELKTGRTHQIRVHLAHIGHRARRRRQVRRLRVEPGACEGRAEADVPARAADDVRAPGGRRFDASRVAAARGARALSGGAGCPTRADATG